MNFKHQKLSPILWTKDLQATMAFYESILGFKGRSNFPNFVSLSREAVEIMFVVPLDNHKDRDDPNTAFFPKPLLTGSLFIVTENVDEIWEKIQGKATIKSSIANRGYLMRDFSILDNNGYELVFGQDISKR